MRKSADRAGRRTAWWRAADSSLSTTPTRGSMDVRRRSPPITAGRIPSSIAPRPAFVFGYSRLNPSVTAAMSAVAVSSATPGRSRPTACRKYTLRKLAGEPLSGSRAQILVLPKSCASWGMTPTAVSGVPSSRMSRPATLGSASNRALHNASVRTTTLDCWLSSEGKNARPSIGVTPRTSKNPAVTH